MANVKKCDRCGAFYEREIRPSLNIVKNELLYSTYIDLCPQCYEDLKKWLKNEVKNEQR